jgi:hypothetical protein
VCTCTCRQILVCEVCSCNNLTIEGFGTSIRRSILWNFETPLPWWCPQAFPPGRPRVLSLGRISPYWSKGDFFKVIRELGTEQKKSSVRLVQTTEDLFSSVAILPSGGRLNWLFDHNRPAEQKIESRIGVPNPSNMHKFLLLCFENCDICVLLNQEECLRVLFVYVFTCIWCMCVVYTCISVCFYVHGASVLVLLW